MTTIWRVRMAILILLAIALTTWGLTRYLRGSGPDDDRVAASGTIEAQQVSVASKIPGRIERLHAGEGDAVRAGETLVTLEGSELAAQIDQARAAVEAARARVAQARAGLTLQIRQVEAQVDQAAAAVDAARAREQQAAEAQTLTASQAALAVRQATDALATATENSNVAKANLDRARQDLARVEALHRDGAVSGQQLDTARAAFAAAQAQYAASQAMVAQAETAVRLARENLAQVKVREREVTAANAAVRQAEAQLRGAGAGEALIAQRRADVAAADAHLAQAEANLRAVQVQQRNLLVTAPIDGVVISRHASAGEIVGSGAPILTIADLSEVWIRLYIPLPKLGLVAVGQRATVTTDAVPGRSFAGTLTEISQQAEFTPRNVQTPEERVKLVFAVKITLPNPDRLLKPGMPADAVIAGVAEP